MSTQKMIDVIVTQVVEVNALVKRFHFVRPDGAPLMAFSGGSHIIVEMKDGDKIRKSPYSLMSSPLDTSDYQISIRRDDDGRGGSLYMHQQVKPGMAMRISAPVNLFAINNRATKHLMIAGGIGITPFIAQAAQLSAAGEDFELHYGASSKEYASYMDKLRISLGQRLHTYIGDHIDFDELLTRQPAGTHLYVCGPEPMSELVLARAKALGWPDGHVHFEHFAKAPPGEPFTVELSNSCKTIRVGKDQSLLEAIESAGVDAPYLCRGGACGQCETNILEADGEILHGDYWLEDDEKAAGNKIMPCVSRFRGSKLVLER